MQEPVDTLDVIDSNPLDDYLSTEQKDALAKIPASDQANEKVKSLIRLPSVHDLELAVGQYYAAGLSADFDLAASLYYIHQHRLWSLDGDHQDFDDFVRTAIPSNESVGKSTARAMVRAYGLCLELADESMDGDGEPVSPLDIWSEIDSTKLNIIADKDPEIRAQLLEAARNGYFKRQLERLRRELKSLGTGDEPESSDGGPDEYNRHDFIDADILEETQLEVDESPAVESDSENPVINIGPDDGPDTDLGDIPGKIVVHATVNEGVPIHIDPKDVEGEFDSIKGMEISKAIGRVMFEFQLGKVRMALVPKVKNDRIVGATIQFDEVRRGS